MKKMIAIFKKQAKETLKNKEILIQFVMFPIITIILTSVIDTSQMPIPKNYFVTMFSAMYIGMAPLNSISAIIAEEKEKGTLDILKMSNVSALQYLISIGSYVFLMCLVGTSIFALLAQYQGMQLLVYFFSMSCGILISSLVGAIIGMLSKNQMHATAVTVPVMLVLSFIPMLSTFNTTIQQYSKYLFSQQINLIITDINTTISIQSLLILSLNFLLVLFLFTRMYRKRTI